MLPNVLVRGGVPMKISWSDIRDGEFEEIVGALLRAMGYQNVERRTGPGDRGWDIDASLTYRSPDGHIDLERWRVECKHHRKAPAPSLIRDHYNRMRLDAPPNSHLLFVTIHPLTNDTRDDLQRAAAQDRIRVSWWDANDLSRFVAEHIGNQALGTLLSQHVQLSYSLAQVRNACERQVKEQISLRVGRKYIPDLFETTTAQLALICFIESDLERYQIQELCEAFLKDILPPPDGQAEAEPRTGATWRESVARLNAASTWSEAQAPIYHLSRVADTAKRKRINTLVDSLKRFRRTCFLIRDKAGSGKTNALCAAAMSLNTGKRLAIFLSGKFDFPPNRLVTDVITQTLASALAHDTHGKTVVPHGPHDLLQEIGLLLRKEQADLTIFIDGINESRNLTALDSSLTHALVELNQYPIKFAITCRDFFWGYFDETQWRPFLFGGFPHPLPAFPEESIDEVVARYFEWFGIDGHVIGGARDNCRQPLLLRLLCEAHRGRSIGEVADIRLLDLFELYRQRKQHAIATKLELGAAGARRVESFLLRMLDDMVVRESTSIPISRLEKVTGEPDLESEVSLYQNLLDEDVILEELPLADAFDRSYQARRVSFVYDEFFDYMLVLSIIRKENWDQHDAGALCLDVLSLMEKAADFSELRGALVYAILMAQRKDMHKVLCALLARLGEYQIVCNVAGKLEPPVDYQWMSRVLRTCLRGWAEWRGDPSTAERFERLRRLISGKSSTRIFELLTEDSEIPDGNASQVPSSVSRHLVFDLEMGDRDVVLSEELSPVLVEAYAAEGRLTAVEEVSNLVWKLWGRSVESITGLLLDWSCRHSILRLAARAVLRAGQHQHLLSEQSVVSLVLDWLLSDQSPRRDAGLSLIWAVSADEMLKLMPFESLGSTGRAAVLASVMRAMFMKYPERLMLFMPDWFLSRPDCCVLAEQAFRDVSLPENMSSTRYYVVWQQLWTLKRMLAPKCASEVGYLRNVIELAYRLRGEAIDREGPESRESSSDVDFGFMRRDDNPEQGRYI